MSGARLAGRTESGSHNAGLYRRGNPRRGRLESWRRAPYAAIQCCMMPDRLRRASPTLGRDPKVCSRIRMVGLVDGAGMIDSPATASAWVPPLQTLVPVVFRPPPRGAPQRTISATSEGRGGNVARKGCLLARTCSTGGSRPHEASFWCKACLHQPCCPSHVESGTSQRATYEQVISCFRSLPASAQSGLST